VVMLLIWLLLSAPTSSRDTIRFAICSDCKPLEENDCRATSWVVESERILADGNPTACCVDRALSCDGLKARSCSEFSPGKSAISIERISAVPSWLTWLVLNPLMFAEVSAANCDVDKRCTLSVSAARLSSAICVPESRELRRISS